jgi:hypothetical protein
MKRQSKTSKKAKPRSVRQIAKPDSVKGDDAERLFDLIATECLHGHRRLFDSLDAYEQKLVIQWLSDALLDGNAENAVHDVLWEIDFIRKPVDVETFITDKHYMGKVVSALDEDALAEGQTAGLHDNWVADLKNVFAPGSQVFEWVMTGGIGIGKTTVAMLAMAYKVYWLSCLRNPPPYYGLLADSLFVFGIYSITKRQVADTGYLKLRGWIDSSPYFRFEYPRNTKIDSQVQFTKQTVKIIPGSQELHALGLDMYSFAMDEVNFMREKRDKEQGQMVGQAYKLYNAVHARMESRFIRPGGTIPGIMLLMSSRNAQTSFLEELLKKRRDSPYTYVSDYALWECKPTHKYVLPKFRVEVGDRIASSRLLRDGNLSALDEYHKTDMTIAKADREAERRSEQIEPDQPRPDARVVEIPGEFLKVFQEDTDQALRDVAGVATFNVNPLIRDRQSVPDAFRDHIPNPFRVTEAVLDVADDEFLEARFNLKKVCRIKASKWVPKLNPNAPRFFHVDLGLTGDAAGIAMGHVSGIVKRERMNPDGTMSSVEHPFIIIDFMLRILPPSGSEIDFSKIRAFLRYVKRLYPLLKVTLDGWQSVDFVQIIRKPPYRLEAAVQSIDKTEQPYVSLRSAHFDRRIGMYEYTPYADEILDLQRDIKAGKVDHPVKATTGGKGSKDVSDAVAGVVFGLINDERFIREAPALDAEMRKEMEAVSVAVIDPDDTDESPVIAPGQRRISGRAVDWEDLRNNVKR